MMREDFQGTRDPSPEALELVALRTSAPSLEANGELGRASLLDSLLSDIVQALLERRQLVDGHGIGQGDAALVEQDQARARGEARQKARERWLAPEVFEM